MIWIYRILFPLAFLITLPWYLRRMLKRGGYGHSFAARFGFVPRLPPPTPGLQRVWIQAVSVGELNAVAPLIQALASTGQHEILLTTTTSTGYALARERLAAHCRVIAPFPLDFLPCRLLTLRRWQPQSLVLMEGELWPELLHTARRRNIPVSLINARLSDRSFQRYRRLGSLRQLVFSPLSQILAASPADAQRFRSLGFSSTRLHITGNLKCDAPLDPQLSPAQRTALRQALFPPAPAPAPAPATAPATAPPAPAPAEPPEHLPILLGSSTWPGEEAFLLDLQNAAEASGTPCLLLIVPRHAERRSNIRDLLEHQPRPFYFRSTNTTPPPGTQIHIADTTGELRLLSECVDLAFIGKSLPPHREGQTPIEAAALGLPIVFGPGMSNFRSIATSLRDHQAALQGKTPQEVCQHLLHALQDPGLRQTLSHNARSWHRSQRGALSKTIAALTASPSPSP